MFLYIEIAEVVGNAFVELLGAKKRRRIYYHELDEYGAKAVEILNQEANVHAVYVVSEESQHDLCLSYSDMFKEFTDENGAMGIELIDGFDVVDVWDRFCAALSMRVIKAFQSEYAVSALG